jgi:hypothetical protein
MKTAQEMTYDFMLALASNMTPNYLKYIEQHPEDADIEADCVLQMAKALTHKYLESL